MPATEIKNTAEMSWSGPARSATPPPKKKASPRKHMIFPKEPSFSIQKSTSFCFQGTPSKRYMQSPGKKYKNPNPRPPAGNENAMDIDVKSPPPTIPEQPVQEPYPTNPHYLAVPGGGRRRKMPGSPARRRKMRRLSPKSFSTPSKAQMMKSSSRTPPSLTKTPSPRDAAYLMRRIIARANAKSPNCERHKAKMKAALNHMLYAFDLNNLKNLDNVNSLVQNRMNELYAEEFTQTREALEMKEESDSELEEGDVSFLGSIRRSVEKLLTSGSGGGGGGKKKKKRLVSKRGPKINNDIFNFANVTVDQLEPEDSPHHARETLKLFNQLHDSDRNFALELIRTTKLTRFKLPEYEELTAHDDMNREYNFEMQFSFGFSFPDNCRMLAKAFDLRKQINPTEERMPRDCSNEIAKMLGSNQFECILKVYFDKTKASATDWHEQDGEAWLYHPEAKTGIKRDLVNFDKEGRVYYVNLWPTTGILCEGDYAGQFPAIPHAEVTDRLERILITWVCSQITWLAFNKVRNLSSKKARNRLSKLLFVLKGWYTGLLLGESFDPVHLEDIIEN